MKPIKVLVVLMLAFLSGYSQTEVKDAEKEAAYTRTINQRAEKIVATLGITDNSKAERVKNIIADQYRNLNNFQTSRDTKIKALKTQSNIDKEALNAQVKSAEDATAAEIQKLHEKYIKDLSKELTAAQIDKVKDGMTYGVVPITYKGYLAMIPELTDKQKDQIMAWLIEAREHAIDAESSDKKHWWFGKYKGRINNYLSAQGYDLKKAGEDWEKRRNAEKEAAAKN